MFHTSLLHLQGLFSIYAAGITFHISARNVRRGRTVLSQDWCRKYAPKSLSCDKIRRESLCDRFEFSDSFWDRYWRFSAVITGTYCHFSCCKIVAKSCSRILWHKFEAKVCK